MFKPGMTCKVGPKGVPFLGPKHAGTICVLRERMSPHPRFGSRWWARFSDGSTLWIDEAGLMPVLPPVILEFNYE